LSELASLCLKAQDWQASALVSRLLKLCSVVCLCCLLSSLLRAPTLQGLAEVLAVMGAAHLSELLPELAASATSKNPFVREGHLTLFRCVRAGWQGG
jgi:hypothetical protein